MKSSCCLLALGLGVSTLALRDDVIVRPVANTSSFGGSLQGFTFPYSGGPKILFNGDFFSDNGKVQKPALLLFDGQKMVQALNASTPVVGRPGESLAAIGDFAISHSSEGSVAFVASVSVANASHDGVYVAAPGFPNAGAVQVATTQGSEGYTSFMSPSVAVSKDGKTLLLAYVANKASGYTAVLVSEVDLATATAGAPQKLVDTGSTIPQSGGLPFLCLSGPSISEAGVVVFFGAHCSDSGSQAVASQAGRRAMYRTRHQVSHCVRQGRDRVWPGVYAASVGSAPSVLASAGTQVPGGAKGATFVAFSNPTIGADGTAGFVAEGPASLGIYATSPAGSLRSVATTNTTLTSGVQLQDFPQPPSVGRGRVAFYASASGAASGVYVEAGVGTRSSAPEPLPLLTEADPAMGAGIVYIGFGAHAYDDTTGEVAVYLVLDNKAQTDGIYLVQDPHGAAPMPIHV